VAKKPEYQKALSTLLLTNERKGELFQRFLEFVDFPRKDAEIYARFREVTGKSLINWSLEANLVLKRGNFIGKVREKSGPPLTLVDFWRELQNSYTEMQSTGILGIRRLAVDIGELRDVMTIRMPLQKVEDFDKYLEELLDSGYGRCISLAGAPVHVLEKRKDIFTYKGKTYLYLTLRS
jgi:hypothetical protein